MSYCRFENTLSDLNDCVEALESKEDLLKKLSESEADAAYEMVTACKRFVALCKELGFGDHTDD